ncbi:hypothetical protein [Hydrogenovibrio sp. JE_KL2]|uniref:hypothetical protein n=1 Tax=Hydrogenovibrio sp. JE_KL2 TaxID=2651188 RepID=UPI00128C616B|nr:hypothetical protein [Hydrogenovibrio sp. JE_KL2]MPQ77181.1 hypothetical protein [Hydrogenovibrio sp. JE_KL2]
MELLENDYEQTLLQALPPNARDLALELLSTYSLGQILALREKTEPDKELLATKHVSDRYWLPLINAAILAKSTYFLPNPKFSQDEIFYLIKAACSSINYPIKQATLKELMEFTQAKEMHVLSKWLQDFSELLLQQNREKSFKVGMSKASR